MVANFYQINYNILNLHIVPMPETNNGEAPDAEQARNSQAPFDIDEFRGALQDNGIYTSHEQTGQTTGRMNVTLSLQAKNEAKAEMLKTMMKSAFGVLDKIKTQSIQNHTRKRIEGYIAELKELNVDTTEYETRLKQ